MKKDNKDKIIELLKTECGLKGELINTILDVNEINIILSEKETLSTIESIINEINIVHEEIMSLESSLTEVNPIKYKN